VLVAVEEFDGIIGLDRESHVADERSGRKGAFNVRTDAVDAALDIKECADADLRIDPLGGYLYL